ncbi:MAG: hypothetical protein FWF24_05400 [Alphaproteobacteria bacterium]|nr:hypothetical protein [Alphaproteobacteria bacterium]
MKIYMSLEKFLEEAKAIRGGYGFGAYWSLFEFMDCKSMIDNHTDKLPKIVMLTAAANHIYVRNAAHDFIEKAKRVDPEKIQDAMGKAVREVNTKAVTSIRAGDDTACQKYLERQKLLFARYPGAVTEEVMKNTLQIATYGPAHATFMKAAAHVVDMAQTYYTYNSFLFRELEEIRAFADRSCSACRVYSSRGGDGRRHAKAVTRVNKILCRMPSYPMPPNPLTLFSFMF